MRRPSERGGVLVAALVLCSFSSALSQTAAPREDRSPEVMAANHRSWGAVSIVDGLPSDAVNAIGQGPDGAIWFATDRGLAVQDGRGTRLVGLGGTDPKRIASLAAARDGRILAATDSGLLVVNGESATPLAGTDSTAYSAVAVDVERSGALMAASVDGRLWFGASVESELVGVDAPMPSGASDALSADQPPDVVAAVAREGGFDVASRRRGLLRIENGSAVGSARVLPGVLSALAVEPSTSSLWIGVANGPRNGAVHRLDREGRLTAISASVGAVTGLGAAEPGACWVATAANGALLLSASGVMRHETFASTIGGLRSDALRCAYTDRDGVAWFGGDRGASRFDRRGPETRPVGGDANGDVVRSISRVDGTIWVGTNRGLYSGAGFSELAPVAGLDGRTVYDVEAASDGRLLAATQQGLFTASRGRNAAPLFLPVDAGGTDLRARAIAVYGGSTYVGSFGAGLLRLDGDTLRTVDFVGAGDALRDIVCLHVDSTGALWIGTAGRGAYRMDGAGLTAVQSDALAGQTVYGIAGTETATLWFATSAGLIVLDGSAEARLLEDCDVRAVTLVGERSALCATANRGAVLVRWDDRFAWLESRIDEERGMPSDTTFAVDVTSSTDGPPHSALIGTSRGLTSYRTSTAPPDVGVVGALANRLLTPAEVESGIVLAYPQRSVVLELFATSTRTFRGQFQYGFVVSDARGEPISRGLVRDGKVSLDRLAPGEYRIDAVAFDNDLVASVERSFRVTVERAPFPWTTTGLALLLLIAVLALIWGARQNRVIAKTNEALRTANTDLADARAQVASETERERSRIARDLHDQTLADLRRLMLLADEMPVASDASAPRPSDLRQQVEEVSGEIRRICEDLSPSALSNLGLGPALEWIVTQAQSELAPERRYTAKVTFSERLEERIGPNPDLPIQIYRIVQEAITNVSRHAGASHVEVSAVVDDDGSLTVEVVDDGVGFAGANEASGAGRGLGNMRWRADMIHASIEWSRAPHGGTVVRLHRPREALKHL